MSGDTFFSRLLNASLNSSIETLASSCLTKKELIGLISQPTAFVPNFRASPIVVPLPIKGSSTVILL